MPAVEQRFGRLRIARQEILVEIIDESAMADMIGMRARQSGTAVVFDMDHTDGTYAAAEFLRAHFDRVVLIALYARHGTSSLISGIQDATNGPRFVTAHSFGFVN